MRPNQVLSYLLWIGLIIFALSMIFTFLWPLLLVFGVIVLIRVLQTRKQVKQAEQEARAYQEQMNRLFENQNSFADDMFYAQAEKKKQEDSMVIDAEYEEREDRGHQS